MLTSQRSSRIRMMMSAVAAAMLASVSVSHALEKGAVTISSDFPGGNVAVEADEVGSVTFAPDLRGDKEWFYWYFEATATKPGRVIFITPEKVAGFKNGGIGFQGPAISSDKGKSWTWMGTETVTDNTFSHDFSKAGETIRFAVTIPYVQSNLDRFLEKHEGNAHLKKSVLTKSRDGREVEILQVGEPGNNRRPMLITCRHHAVETMASYLLEGFLTEAISDTAEGKAFRDRFVLHVVPFVDKDGVEKGDQGKNRKPHDHNRDYKEDSIYPEVQAIMKLGDEVKFRYALDMHCPTLVMDIHQVMYFVGAKAHPPNNYENVKIFADRIRKGLPEGAPTGPLVWLRDESDRSPKSSRYFGFQDGVILSATFEFPFAPKGRAMEIENCRDYGRIVLKAWVHSQFKE